MKFNNIGIAVKNLDRSIRFYCDGLGFQRADSHEMPSEAGLAKIQFVQSDSLRIELLHFEHPGEAVTKSVAQTIGLTHFAFFVDDGEAVVAKVEEYGGKIEKRSEYVGEDGIVAAKLFLLQDPDGVRIELIQQFAG